MGTSAGTYGAWLLLAAVVGGALAAARLLLREAPIRYERRASLLDGARRACYPALREACDGRWVIHTAQNAADVVQPRASSGNASHAGAKLTARPLDFVLCSAESLEPRIAVVLEDVPADTANDNEPTARDPSIRQNPADAVMASVGVPLLRLPRTDEYDPAIVRQALDLVAGGKRPDRAT